MRQRTRLAVILIVSAGVTAGCLTESPARETDSGIAWYGVLSDGLAEAERTGKPILLVSAAPQCIGVSGMW